MRVYLDQIVAGNDDGELVARLTTADGKLVAEHRHGISGSRAQDAFRMTGLTGIRLWDIDEPVLYHLAISISGNNFSHQFTTRVGFRQAEFTPDGFLLNGRSLKIRGINRHQSYPYMGYAMGLMPRGRMRISSKHTQIQSGQNLALSAVTSIFRSL